MIWSNYTQKLASWKGNLFISGKSRWRWHIIPFGQRWLSSFWIKQHLKLNNEHKKKHIACLISLSKCFFVFRLPIFWSFPIWLLKKIHGRGWFQIFVYFHPWENDPFWLHGLKLPTSHELNSVDGFEPKPFLVQVCKIHLLIWTFYNSLDELFVVVSLWCCNISCLMLVHRFIKDASCFFLTLL